MIAKAACPSSHWSPPMLPQGIPHRDQPWGRIRELADPQLALRRAPIAIDVALAQRLVRGIWRSITVEAIEDRFEAGAIGIRHTGRDQRAPAANAFGVHISVVLAYTRAYRWRGRSTADHPISGRGLLE